MHGFINVKKEAGWTSHDVVAKLRGVLKNKRIGHTGTLDPEAEGVLVVAVGQATKFIQYMEDVPKTYLATMIFGLATDTEDIHGEVVETREIHEVDGSLFEACLTSMKGNLCQTPPMYSAIKIKGKKLYQLARKGIEIDRPSRSIIVYDNRILQIPRQDENGQWKAIFEVHCSKGTYIRTYCKDLALCMNTIGVMSELCRTAVGSFAMKEALTVQQIMDYVDRDDFSFLLPIPDVLPGKKYQAQSDIAQNRVMHGNYLEWNDLGIHGREDIDDPLNMIIVSPHGDFLAMGQCADENDRIVKMKKVMAHEDN